MNPYSPEDPTPYDPLRPDATRFDPANYDPTGAGAPFYVDPVTGQQLHVDPVTGALTYPGQPGGDPLAPAYPGGGYPGAPVGYPPAGFPPQYPAFGAPGYGYPSYAYPGSRSTNGLAIGSMVSSIVGLLTFFCYGFGGLLGLVGAILGHVALRQVRQRGEGGRGMAITGIVVGWLSVAVTIVAIVLIGWLLSVLSHADVNN